MKFLSIRKLSIFIVPILFSQSLYADSAKMHGSVTKTLNDVRVRVVELSDEYKNSGKVLITGDCELCNQEYEFLPSTKLRTAFYNGLMDVANLENQQFAKGSVRVNTEFMSVREVNYIGIEE